MQISKKGFSEFTVFLSRWILVDFWYVVSQGVMSHIFFLITSHMVLSHFLLQLPPQGSWFFSFTTDKINRVLLAEC